PALAGYKALRLLLAETPHVVEDLRPAVWERWAPIIVLYPYLDYTLTADAHRELVARAYSRAPEAIAEYLRCELAADDPEARGIPIVWKFERCAGEPLQGVLLDALRDPRLPESRLEEIL